MCTYPVPQKHHPCGHDIPNYTTIEWCREKWGMLNDPRRFAHPRHGPPYTKWNVAMCPNPHTVQWVHGGVCEQCRIMAMVEAGNRRYKAARQSEYERQQRAAGRRW
nr:hypothetical protein CFP56_32140 [Quercus suber]